MRKLGLFYGSDTGNTEEVAKKMEQIIGPTNISLYDIKDASIDDFADHDYIIIGTPTWYDGELQSDWEEFFPHLDYIDFMGKKIALFGLGDQYTYGDYFCDGIGILYDKAIDMGATIVGEWPIEDYEFDESVAERDGMFVGLTIDDDNEPEKTDERIRTWLKQISGKMGFTV